MESDMRGAARFDAQKKARTAPGFFRFSTSLEGAVGRASPGGLE